MKIYIYKNLAARGAPLTKFYFSKNHSGLKNKFFGWKFSKNHSGLKNECFGWKFANTFLLFQRKIAKKKIWNKKFEQYFLGSQISAIFVLLGLGNTQKIEFLFIICFKKIKKYILSLRCTLRQVPWPRWPACPVERTTDLGRGWAAWWAGCSRRPLAVQP